MVRVYFNRIDNKIHGLDEEFIASLENPVPPEVLESVIADIEKLFAANPDKNGQNLTTYLKTALRRKLSKHTQAAQHSPSKGSAAAAQPNKRKFHQELIRDLIQGLELLYPGEGSKLDPFWERYTISVNDTSASLGVRKNGYCNKSDATVHVIDISQPEALQTVFEAMKLSCYPAPALHLANRLFGLQKTAQECEAIPFVDNPPWKGEPEHSVILRDANHKFLGYKKSETAKRRPVMYVSEEARRAVDSLKKEPGPSYLFQECKDILGIGRKP